MDFGKQFAIYIAGALNKTVRSKVNHLSCGNAMKAKFNAHLQSKEAESWGKKKQIKLTMWRSNQNVKLTATNYISTIK